MPGGRPTRYQKEFPEQVYRLALLGLTDEEIASFFEVDARTLYRWDIDHPEFCQSRARGKIPADAHVAAKLYHRALGYSHEAVKIFMPAGASAPVYAKYQEHYAPDTQAAQLWLNNRQPGRWKDRRHVELNHNVVAAGAGDADLLAIALTGSGSAATQAGDKE
jgi:hypothetical protein